MLRKDESVGEKKHVAAEEYSLEMIPWGGHVCFGERGRERESASECVYSAYPAWCNTEISNPIIVQTSLAV